MGSGDLDAASGPPYASRVAKLENNFTWSPSRHATFERCKRQYWWTYYGSWGGWEYTASGETRAAYILKNLHNRWTWAGTVVHDTIERILRDIQRHATSGALLFQAPEIDVDREVEKVTKRMRENWRESRSGDYHKNPKRHFGLAEHEYEDEVPKAEWAKINARAVRAVRDFLRSDLFEHIRTSDPTRWLPIEELDQFDFEGTPVWAVLDFAHETPDGTVVIYDWKTGEMKKDQYRTQLGVYALYMEASRNKQSDQVETHLVFLGNEMQVLSIPVNEEDLKATRGVMRASIAAMKNRLKNVEQNVAERDDFPLTDDLDRCEVCAFRRLCGRE